jgi:hypothetical protein
LPGKDYRWIEVGEVQGIAGVGRGVMGRSFRGKYVEKSKTIHQRTFQEVIIWIFGRRVAWRLRQEQRNGDRCEVLLGQGPTQS